MKNSPLCSLVLLCVFATRLEAGGHNAAIQACSAVAASNLCIIHGEDLRAEEKKKYSSTVPLKIDLPGDRERSFNGTVVGKNCIITAGHCVEEESVNRGQAWPAELPELDFYLDRKVAEEVLSVSAKKKYLQEGGTEPIKMRAKVLTRFAAVDGKRITDAADQQDAAVLLFEDGVFSESAWAKPALKDFPQSISEQRENVVAVATGYTEAKFDRDGKTLSVNAESLKGVKKTKAELEVAGFGSKAFASVTDYTAGEPGTIKGDSGGGVYSKEDDSYVGLIGQNLLILAPPLKGTEERTKIASIFIPLSNPDLTPLWKEAEARGADGLGALTGSAKKNQAQEFQKVFIDLNTLGKPNNCPPVPEKK